MTKLLLDEHIDPELGDYLSQLGHEIRHALNKDRGKQDIEHFQSAQENKEVIVTRDDDFLSIAKENNHQGLIFLTSYADTSKLGKQVEKVLELYGPEELQNTVIYLPEPEI